MGKRKSRTKPLPMKKLSKLDTIFCCPFNNLAVSAGCRIDRKEAICRICEGVFTAKIHALTEPIDIYSEWLDAPTNSPQP
ncbi:hypothetical protein AMTRI_Chr13g125010 [Amborella trichopoda]